MEEPMRKLFLLMNVSLDGYFEAPGHDISWTVSDFEAFSSEGSQDVDTLLFGHRTYNMMKAFWPTAQAQQMIPDVAKVMNETCKVVVSHTPFDPGWNNVVVMTGDVIENVKKLKEQPGKTIGMFGSNSVCVNLMQAGLVDEFQILVNPVAIGAGTSLFHGLPQKASLTLRDSRAFKSGVVMLTYVPA
jgi:dihydrofolate reductase